MSTNNKAGVYVALTAVLGLAALPVIAWQVNGFNAADPRWWKWLGEYMLTTRSFPGELLTTLNYTLLGWVAITTLAVIVNPFGFEPTDYGGATFAVRSMFKKMGLTASSGIVLGRAGGRLLIYDRPLSTLLLAPPGAGKTAGVAIPTMLSFRHAVVMNDPKGEVYEATAGWRSRLGPVYRIEWNKGAKSTCWNPLSWTSLPEDPSEMEIAVDRLAAIFVQADKAKGADFWVKSAREAISAIILFHLYEAKRNGGEATFADILSWMAVAGDPAESEGEESNDPIAIHYRLAAGTAKIEGYPRRIADALNSIANQNFRSRADVLKTAEMGLAVFRNSYVAAATSRSDFDLRSLRTSKRPVSVYVVVPPENADIFGPITGALIELSGLMAVSSKGRPILFMLDEVPELPALDIVKRGPAIGRGQDVRFVIIAQDIGQLVERYGKTGFDTIMTTTAYKVVLTQNHPDTQEMISKMIGHVTREKASKSRQVGTELVARGSVSKSLEGVPLVRPEALGSMRNGDQLVIAQQFMRHPIKSQTAFYFKLGVFKRRSKIPPPT